MKRQGLYDLQGVLAAGYIAMHGSLRAARDASVKDGVCLTAGAWARAAQGMESLTVRLPRMSGVDQLLTALEARQDVIMEPEVKITGTCEWYKGTTRVWQMTLSNGWVVEELPGRWLVFSSMKARIAYWNRIGITYPKEDLDGRRHDSKISSELHAGGTEAGQSEPVDGGDGRTDVGLLRPGGNSGGNGSVGGPQEPGAGHNSDEPGGMEDAGVDEGNDVTGREG